MKVQIGTRIIDSNDEAVLLFLSDDEKHLISESGEQKIFCSYPASMACGEAETLVAKFSREIDYDV